MKLRLKKIPDMYFSNWRIPSAICLFLLMVFTMTSIPHWNWIATLSDVFFVCLTIAFLGILSSGVWNLFKKRWSTGIANLVMFFICGIITFLAMGFLMYLSMLGPSEDGFDDKLKITPNIDAVEPMRAIKAAPGGEKDPFQQRLLKSLSFPGDEDPTITADVDALLNLYATKQKVLMRYLSTSPSWRVFKKHGNIFATRRWMIGSKWNYELHGYYTRHDIDTWLEAGIPNFQFRFTVGFSDKPWARVSRDSTLVGVGQTSSLVLSKGNQMHESRCIISAEGLVVEVFEQSEAKERRLTKTALSYVGKELNTLLQQTDWKSIRSILPHDSIRMGDPVFELRHSQQPGIYDSEIWVNPREPGMLYLKAFEVTKETPLSTEKLKERSNEWVGWSDDPRENFLSNTHFTIYEGDWGKPYAARFEVWFAADSGADERKLMERIIKIEGWQR